jgi:hypothetical protein
MSGPVPARVHLGAYGTLLRELVQAHPAKRFLLLIDEWSGLPLALQPYRPKCSGSASSVYRR